MARVGWSMEGGCRAPAASRRGVLDGLPGFRGTVAFCLAAIGFLTTCQLDELTSPGEISRLAVGELSHLDSARLGSAATRVRTATLTVTGTSASLRFGVAVQGGSPWLALDASSGAAPGSLSLTLDPAGLELGEHRDTVVFTAESPDASPLKVGIAFRIIGCHEEDLGAAPASITDAITAEDCASPRAAGRFARLYRFTGAAHDSIIVQATSTAFAPSIAVTPVAGGAALAESSDCEVGAGEGNACLRYVRLPEAGAYLVEVTSVAAGATGAHQLTIGRPRAPEAPTALEQEAAGAGLTIAVGAPVNASAVMLGASLVDADLDTMRLEVELRPAGEPFTGVATGSSAWGSGPSFSVEQAGLSDDVGYHWRVRAIDGTGRASPWVEFGANAAGDDDFSVAIADAPAAPGALAQSRADGTTPIVGDGTTDEPVAVFSATVTDPDPGDQLRLEVEVRPVGAAFTGVPTASSAPVSAGGVASVEQPGLADDVGYRWRARAVDAEGRASAWVAFGTGGADFRVALPPVRLAFVVAPVGVAAGAVMSPAVRVAAQDASGATRTSFSGIIRIALGAGSIGGALSGTTSVSAVDGIATFGDLSVDLAGDYTLVASLGAFDAESDAFSVDAGSGQALVFVDAPVAGTAGVALVPAPRVSVRDALGNVAAGFTGDVSLSLGGNPPGGTLTGTTTVAAVAGVATFTDVRIDRAGGGHTLIASGTGLASAQSGAVTIAAAAAAALEIRTEPATTGGSGLALARQPVVRLLDAFGNPVAVAGVQVTASIADGLPGASLTNATATTDADGVATFSGLALAGGGGSYTLAFAAAGLAGATSSSITLGAGAATRLVMVVEPSASARNGEQLLAQPVVRLLDAPGNMVAAAGVAVTVSIATGGGTIGGTTTVLTAADGTASFGELSITGTVGARTLRFEADGLASATSGGIAITAGDATQVARVSADGQVAQAGADVAAPPSVVVRDLSGNPVAGVPVTFTITQGAGVVTPAEPVVTLASGIATLTSWTLGAGAGANAVEARATGLDGSPVIFGATGTAGAATALLIAGGDDLTGPVGTTLGTPHEVRVVDANGNPVAGVTVAWAAIGGGSVEPSLSVSGVDGIASTVRELGGAAGPQGTTATASLIGGQVSVSFDIMATVGGPSQLSLVSGDAQAGTVGGQLAAPLEVLVRDTEGNPVSGVAITWSVIDGGGAVTPSMSLTDASGVASASWTLGTLTTPTDSTQLARATGVGSPINFVATSRPGPVSAAQTLVAVAPASAGASRDAPVTVTVTARDAFGNAVPGRGVVLTASGGGNTLAQPAAVTNASGVATGAFGSITTGVHTLSATVDALPAVQQPEVTIVPAPAARLAFVTGPSDVTAGASIAPTVAVELLDSLGNRATTSAANVTIALAANPGASALGGTPTRATIAGVATFPDLTVDRAAAGYQLGAASGTLTGVVSTEFAVLTGAVSATRSSVTAGPGSVAAGVASTITVTARDANDNPVAGAEVAIAATGAGNSIAQPLGVTDANGIATGTVSSTVAGARTVSATIGAVAVTEVASLTVVPAAISATVSEITASPETVSTDAGTSTITVTARDAFGNAVPGATVVLAATGALNTLAQPAAVTDAGGIATGSLASTRAEVKTVSATVDGVPLVATATVTVGTGAVSAVRSSVVATDVTLTAGGAATTITVTARDANDNSVAGVAVVLAADGSDNTLDQPVATTDANGVATGAIASTRAEQKTVTATAGGIAVAQAAVITVSPAAVSAAESEVSASPTTVAPGEASTITVTARDAFGNPVPDAAVVLASSGTDAVTAQPAVTSAAGVTAGSITWTAAEQKTVTAAINGVPIAQAATVTVTAGSVSAATSTVSAAPGSVVAGTATSTITVTARDASGNPVAGAAVVLSATGAGNTLVQPTATTDASGVATGTIASTGAGTKGVSATIGGVAITQVAEVIVSPAALSPTASTVELSTNVISAGAGSAAVTVTALDEFLNPVPGATVVLAATGAGNTLTQPAAVTDANGVATGAISSTVSEAKTITATVDAVPLSQAPVVTVTPDAADGGQSTLLLSAPTVVAGGEVTVTVTARDASGNPVPGVTVGVSATGTGNTLTDPVPLTDANGVSAVTFSSTVAEAKTITATVNGVAVVQQGGLAVTPAAVSEARSTVVTSAPSIVAGTGTATITVTVRDAFDNPVPGATVELGSNGAAVVQPVAVTDAAGVTTGSVSSAATGTFAVAAIANGTAIAQQATVTVTPGAVSAALSTVSAEPGMLVAGVAASTITVTARDGNGNLVPGATVVLTSSGTGNTVTSPVAVTDASGVAVGSFASTRAEEKVITATIDDVAVAAGAAITVTPAAVSATTSTLVADPTGITAVSGSSTLTVTARDEFGNPIVGAAVVLAATGDGNTLSQPGAVTDAGGVATGTIASTASGAKTVSASVAGTPITQTATVTVAPGPADVATSTVAVSAPTVEAGGEVTVTVTARDAGGNPVEGVTVVVSANGAGDGVAGPTATTDVAGVATATFSSTTAGANVIAATVDGAAVTAQAALTVTPGPVSATTSTLVADPTTITAVSGISTLTVTARDAFSNPVADAVVVLAADGTGNSLAQPSVTDANGVTTGTLSSSVSEAKTLTATINGTPVTQTATVMVDAGAATAANSTVEVSAATAVAGTSVTVTVTARDAGGNPVGGVAVVVSADGLGNTITGPVEVTNANGVATATFLSTVAEAKTIAATIDGVPLEQAAAITITPAAADPANTTIELSATTAVAGDPVTVTLTARDANGNLVPGSAVVLQSPSQDTEVQAGTGTTDVNGVFTATVVSTFVQGAAIVAGSIDGLPIVTNAEFEVTPGPAAMLAFLTAPSDAVAGSPIAPALDVSARDAFGNVASSFTGSVTLSIQPGTGTGGAAITSGSIVTVAAVAGIATFDAIAIDIAGTGYALLASSSGITSASSALFAVTPAAPEPDAAFTDPAAATVDAVGGVATFSAVAIDLAGIGYQLQATTAGVAGTFVSGTFDITVAGPLAFAGVPHAPRVGRALPAFAR